MKRRRYSVAAYGTVLVEEATAGEVARAMDTAFRILFEKLVSVTVLAMPEETKGIDMATVIPHHEVDDWKIVERAKYGVN